MVGLAIALLVLETSTFLVPNKLPGRTAASSFNSRSALKCNLATDTAEAAAPAVDKIPSLDLPEDAPLQIPNQLKFTDDASGAEKALQSFKFNFMTPNWKKVAKGSVLQIDIQGDLPLTAGGNIFSGKGLGVQQICSALLLGAHDPRIDAALIKLNFLNAGSSDLQEIRRHMDYFKQSGKPLVGFTNAVTQKEFYVGSGCSEFYVTPEAYLRLSGYSIPISFYKGALDKVGIEPQVERIGAYKSAGDTFSRYNASQENIEVIETLIESVAAHWKEQVAKDTNHSAVEANELIDTAPNDVAILNEGGWITGMKYADEMKDMMEERFGQISIAEQVFSTIGEGLSSMAFWNTKISSKPDQDSNGKVKYIEAGTYLKKVKTVAGAPGAKGQVKVLVIPVSGAIMNDLQAMQNSITPDKFGQMISKAEENPNVDAVVVWIDSPGGDAIASDLMWRKVQRLSKTKPVVACMGNVAASGGYYISMGCDKIVCNPLTITGSIGVVSLKFTLEDLFERIGYNIDRISTGKFAEVEAGEKRFTPEEEKYYKDSVMSTYKKFVTKAAESRGMTYEEMNKVAQGRVWTGQQAVKLGLVDDLGGIWKAIDVAKELCQERGNITESLKARVQFLKPESNFAQDLVQAFAGGASLSQNGILSFGLELLAKNYIMGSMGPGVINDPALKSLLTKSTTTPSLINPILGLDNVPSISSSTKSVLSQQPKLIVEDSILEAIGTKDKL